MSFSPLQKASRIKLPPLAISVSKGGAKEPTLRVLMLADYARANGGMAAGDRVHILAGDKGTPDEGYLLLVKTADKAGIKVRVVRGLKDESRLQILTTNIKQLGDLRKGTMEPEDVTFPKAGHLQFRLPAALLPLPIVPVAPVKVAPVKVAKPPPVKEPLQAPLPAGHPNRAPSSPIRVNGNGHDKPRVVLKEEPAPAVRGSVMS